MKPAPLDIAPKASRGDGLTVGTLVGLTALLGFEFIYSFKALQDRNLVQIGGTLALASFAGFIAGALALRRLPSRARALGTGARVGLRCGSLTGLVAGACLCTAAFLRVLACDYAEDEAPARAKMWTTLIVALAALLPSASAAFFGGSLSAVLRRPKVGEGMSGQSAGGEPHASRPWAKWSGRGVIAVSILCFLLPLSTLGKDWKPFLVVPSEPVRPRKFPPWRYYKPEGFATASPSQFFIQHREPLPASSPNSPFSISPDEKWLIYSTAVGPSLVRIDLETGKTAQEYPIQQTASALAWSPDSTRILIVPEDRAGGGQLQIARIDSGRITALPLPHDRDIPEGEVIWATETEVIFIPESGETRVFDLDDLRFYPLHLRTTLAATDWTKACSKSPPATDTWTLEAGECVSGIRLPSRRQPDALSGLSSYACLAIAHPTAPVRCLFPAFPLSAGVIIVPTRDCSRVARIEQGNTELFFFSLRNEERNQFRFTLPEPKNSNGVREQASQALDDHSLGVVAYAPLVNPLNHKVIGPDRGRPRGLLRLVSWDIGSAVAWAAETYTSLGSDSVGADLHQRDGQSLLSSHLSRNASWWTPLGDAVAEAKITPYTEDSALHVSLSLAAKSGWFTTVIGGKHSTPEPKDQMHPTIISTTEDKIRQFVILHHKKAEQGDLGKLVIDYAPQVNYLGKPMTPSAIMEEELRYHERWNIIEETIVSAIKIERNEDKFEVNYTVYYHIESKTERITAKNDLSLTIEIASEGFQIRKQTARIHGLKSEKI